MDALWEARQATASELQRERFAMTIFDLPSAQAILPYLGDSYSLVTRTKTGLLSQGTSIIPGSSLGLLMGSYLFVGVARPSRAASQLSKSKPLSMHASRSRGSNWFCRESIVGYQLKS